jgi:acetoin utilization deacetylase AcuC-like enzyme
MRVVYSPAHLAHDVVTETVMGAAIPANEVAERAERIRATLEADGGFAIEEPTEHGSDPILAVHDPGLVRFVDEAWQVARAQSIARPSLLADTFPTFRMFEGMSPEFLASRPETRNAAGRAGWWGLDTANPLVAGTAGAARAAVDVALTTADLVLGGERAAYGLCRPPGHHAARSMAGGYCFFNNAAIAAEAIVRARGERVAILDVDYHHGNGTQQIFWRRGDVQYVSLHADPERQFPFFLGWPDETGEGEGSGANLNIRSLPERTMPPISLPWTAASTRSPPRPATSSSSRSGSTPMAMIRSATSPSRQPHTTSAVGGSRRWGGGWSSSRRAAITGHRSGPTPGHGCVAPRDDRTTHWRRPGSADAVRIAESAGRRTIRRDA